MAETETRRWYVSRPRRRDRDHNPDPNYMNYCFLLIRHCITHAPVLCDSHCKYVGEKLNRCFREAYDLISMLHLLLSVSFFHYLFVCADVERIRNNTRERTLASGIRFGSVRL